MIRVERKRCQETTSAERVLPKRIPRGGHPERLDMWLSTRGENSLHSHWHRITEVAIYMRYPFKTVGFDIFIHYSRLTVTTSPRNSVPRRISWIGGRLAPPQDCKPLAILRGYISAIPCVGEVLDWALGGHSWFYENSRHGCPLLPACSVCHPWSLVKLCPWHYVLMIHCRRSSVKYVWPCYRGLDIDSSARWREEGRSSSSSLGAL